LSEQQKIKLVVPILRIAVVIITSNCQEIQKCAYWLLVF